MYTLAFWKATGERVIVTFAEVMLGFIVAGTTSILGFDWKTALSISAMAAFAALLKAIIAGSGLTFGAGPSLVSAEQVLPEGKEHAGSIVVTKFDDSKQFSLELESNPDTLEDGDQVVFKVREDS